MASFAAPQLLELPALAAGSLEVGSAHAGKGDRQRAGKQRAQRKRIQRKRAQRKRAQARRRGRVVCSGKGDKRRCRRVRGRFRGHPVSRAELRTEPLPQPSGQVHLVNVNLGEVVKVDLYREDGKLDEESLSKLDHAFRCRRTKEVHAVDPRLFEIMSVIQDHFGGRPIHLVSGFRFQRNEGSRHFHASAMDIKIPGVSAKELYRYAQSLDPGGMGIGIYPREGFVHVDFRAPGEKSYRWVDRSRGDSRTSDGKKPSKLWRPRPRS